MLIGLMADSHDNLPKIEKAVEFFNQKKVELVLHAGDFVAPFVVEKLKNLNSPLIGVFGNNDGEKRGLTNKVASIGGKIYPSPYSFTWEGKRILLLHDPAKLKNIDISSFCLVVYGHTHRKEIRREGDILLVNPGECGGWLTGRCTVGLVDLEGQKVSIEAIS